LSYNLSKLILIILLFVFISQK